MSRFSLVSLWAQITAWILSRGRLPGEIDAAMVARAMPSTGRRRGRNWERYPAGGGRTYRDGRGEIMLQQPPFSPQCPEDCGFTCRYHGPMHRKLSRRAAAVRHHRLMRASKGGKLPVFDHVHRLGA